MKNNWKITLWGTYSKTLTLLTLKGLTEAAAKAAAKADYPNLTILECIPAGAESDIHPSWY